MARRPAGGARFLRRHVDGEDVAVPASAVRVHVGRDGWRDLDAWPPPVEPEAWALGAGGSLSTLATPGPASVIRYDPRDPTPSAGGPVLGRDGGVADQRRIERRDDVLVHTSAPLTAPLEVLGSPRAELRLRIEGAGAHVVVRLCEVDVHGVSRNVTDGAVRVPAAPGLRRRRRGVVVPLSRRSTASPRATASACTWRRLRSPARAEHRYRRASGRRRPARPGDDRGHARPGAAVPARAPSPGVTLRAGPPAGRSARAPRGAAPGRARRAPRR